MRALILALALASAASAAEPAAEPGLDAIAADGVRACMSISTGRTPAEAAPIFGFTPAGAAFARETARGKVDLSPPEADRSSCRTSVSALTLDNNTVLDALKAFLTTPPQRFAPVQSRVVEKVGNFPARVTIWAASGGDGTLTLVTIYEILANEYYLGPKVIIDHVVNRR